MAPAFFVAVVAVGVGSCAVKLRNGAGPQDVSTEHSEF